MSSYSSGTLGGMDSLVRRVALSQMFTMNAGELLERAVALRGAPPVPPGFEGTGAETALAEQSVLASALAPLRVEFDDAQWTTLSQLVLSGLTPDLRPRRSGPAILQRRAAPRMTKAAAPPDRKGAPRQTRSPVGVGLLLGGQRLLGVPCGVGHRGGRALQPLPARPAPHPPLRAPAELWVVLRWATPWTPGARRTGTGAGGSG